MKGGTAAHIVINTHGTVLHKR